VPQHDAKAFFMRHTNPCGHLRITAQRRQCQQRVNTSNVEQLRRATHRFSHNGSATAATIAHCAPEPAPEPAHCRLAVCMFGILARYGVAPSSMHDYDAWLTEHIAHPSLRRVMQANAGTCEHDVFVHTWETGARAAFIERLYAPRRGEYGARPGDGASGMFLSIERVLALRRAEEVVRGVRYDWVLCTRYDAVWMAPLPLRWLRPGLFYVANWCAAVAPRPRDRHLTPATPSMNGRCAAAASSSAASRTTSSVGSISGGSSCRPLSLFAPATHQLDGVPDYFMLAAPALADAAFEGLTEAVLAGRLVPTGRSCCNHLILATRLKAAGLWTRLGRVLTHHMDIETLREPKFDVGGRLACWQQLDRRSGRQRAGEAECADLRGPAAAPHWLGGEQEAVEYGQPALTSRCPATRRYCLCEEQAWAKYPVLTGSV
jgi:hypothetical protein